MKRTNAIWAHSALLLAGVCGIASFGSAHTMYVNVTDYAPRPDGATSMYFGWGHRLPIDDALRPEKVKTCQLLDPDGKVHLLPKPTGFLTTVQFTREGTHLLGAVLNPGFYTVYLEDGETKHKLGPKTGLKNVVLSLYSQQQGKAILNVGATSDTFRRSLGHELEIIPLANPALLRTGDYLPLQVLFHGKPVPGYPAVMATYLGFSTTDAYAYTTMLVHGRARVKILREGVWFIKVNYRLPATGAMAEKCNELSYTATLTFEAGGFVEPEK